MTVKEKIEKEISKLSTHELMKLHDMILWLQRDRKLPSGISHGKPPYLRVREALKDVGNLSDGFIMERAEIL